MPAFWLCSLNFLFGHCLSEGLSMLRHPLSSDQNGTVRGQLVDPAYLLNKNNIVCFFVWRERTEKEVNTSASVVLVFMMWRSYN